MSKLIPWPESVSCKRPFGPTIVCPNTLCRHFGPSLAPLLQVGYRGAVEVDSGGRAHILNIDDFKRSCSVPTWEAMMYFVTSLKKVGTKIAFFSATPQGGGVALMRHALVRLADLLGVDLTWYVPKPKPGVFRITKTVHNILQGVAEPGVRISAEEKQVLVDWIGDNAKRYWLSPGQYFFPSKITRLKTRASNFVRCASNFWANESTTF